MQIHVNLTGEPFTLINSEKIDFPTKKTEAIFYYLLLTKKASRNTLAFIFWPDSKESSAKKNLRNALYCIKKCVGIDLFINDKGWILLKDTVDFTINSNPLQGEFMEGFHLKASEEFQDFLSTYRNKLHAIYTDTIKSKFEKTLKTKKENEILKLFYALKRNDPYNENIYRSIMKFYLEKSEYIKGIELYKELYETLMRDLHIEPEKETLTLYKDMLHLKKSKNKNEYFYGRQSELKKLNSTFIDFINNTSYKHYLICAPIGGGKTTLKNYFLKALINKNVLILNATCYEAEKSCYFKIIGNVLSQVFDYIKNHKIWVPENVKTTLSYIFPFAFDTVPPNNIHQIEKISAFTYYQINEALLSVFSQLLSHIKVVIIIDDIQFLDTMSLNLLSSLIIRNHKKGLWFLSTSREENLKDIAILTNPLFKKDQLDILHLPYFTPLDIESILCNILGNKTSPALIENLFIETKGNPLFLFEYINNLDASKNEGIQSFKFFSLLKNKVQSLDSLEKKVLYLSSYFFGNIEHKIIEKLLCLKEIQVLEVLERLQNYGFIKEEASNNGIQFFFVHEKFREFIYKEQTAIKKQLIHNKIGEYLVENLYIDARDYYNYDKIIYHFEKSNNSSKYLTYRIKKFQFLLDSNIEFPEFISIITHKALKELEKELHSNKIPTSLQLDFLLSKATYEIKTCQYTHGIISINKIINSTNSTTHLIKAYHQMIFYGIQVRDLKIMHDYIIKTLQLIRTQPSPIEKGKILRFYGLYHIMKGNFNKAENLLKKSITIFEHIQCNQYSSLNLASSYNYLGYIHKYNMDYQSAINYYNKAIDICLQSNMIHGLTVFYTNMGQALFELKKYDAAKKYFLQAEVLYEKIYTIWSRPLTESYMALIYFYEGKYQYSKKYLTLAVDHSTKLQNLYETSYVLKAKTIIKSACLQNAKIRPYFQNLLNESLTYYIKEAIHNFEKLNLDKEVEYLNQLY